MAGQREGIFKELISPFLRGKLDELIEEYGIDSPQYNAIARQYIMSPLETTVQNAHQRRRHYEAEVHIKFKGQDLKGVERLYKRTVLLEPTTACAAHCRWCLRGQYDINALSSKDINLNLEYFASLSDIREILITGGEPLIALTQLEYILDGIEKNVPQVEIVRIGARILSQAPERVTEQALIALGKKRRFRIEIGVHVCHPIELWPETRAKINALNEQGVRLYNQHPLLKGVNDTEEALIDLYDQMRTLNIESHYLFHCIPIQNMSHHRTTVQHGIDLIGSLTSGGHFSGRTKPIFAAMTDVGKVALFQGSILKYNEERDLVLLKTHYKYEDRMKWNPSWKVPEWCEISSDGYLNVWYPDGANDDVYSG